MPEYFWIRAHEKWSTVSCLYFFGLNIVCIVLGSDFSFWQVIFYTLYLRLLLPVKGGFAGLMCVGFHSWVWFLFLFFNSKIFVMNFYTLLINMSFSPFSPRFGVIMSLIQSCWAQGPKLGMYVRWLSCFS